jgi:ABC-2 type transport system ATP-binding protein
MVTIKLHALGQTIGNKPILNDISLEWEKGVYGLLGPNGAGKTTLLRTLATLLLPATGTLLLLGKDVRDTHQQQHIRRLLGYLPQSFAYYADFTVQEFVTYIALLKEMPDATMRDSVQEAVALVGLGEQRSARLKTLSGGMIRRVGIAQAIVNRPQLLLLDEPTVGLDPHQRIEFRALIRALGETGTVVVSTHLVEDVAVSCREVAVLYQGRLVYTGSPADLEARGRIPTLTPPIGDTPLERGYSVVLAQGQRA